MTLLIDWQEVSRMNKAAGDGSGRWSMDVGEGSRVKSRRGGSLCDNRCARCLFMPC